MDTRVAAIKNRMVKKALQIWNIEEKSMLDPVISLFFDVFASEFAIFEDELLKSDAKLLERIASIMTKQNWSLPIPSHALIQIKPSEQDNTYTLSTKDRISTNFNTGIEIPLRINFTALVESQIINAYIQAVAKNKQVDLYHPNNKYNQSLNTSNQKIPNRNIWIGIDIEDELLEQSKKLSVCITHRDGTDENFFPLINFFHQNNKLETQLISEQINNETQLDQYTHTIINKYRNNLFQITLPQIKEKENLLDKLSNYCNREDLIRENKELFWINLQFPNFINDECIENISVQINCLPIVNRTKHETQHNIKQKGNIISLNTNLENEKTFHRKFLNLEKIDDNLGNHYIDITTQSNTNKEGTYALFSGNSIEKFDQRQARQLLNTTLQSIKEEGSSFSLLGSYNKNFVNELEKIDDMIDSTQRKVDNSFGKINPSDRYYSHTQPIEKSQYLFAHYWSTDPNDIVEKIPLQQPFEIDNKLTIGNTKDWSIQLVSKFSGGISNQSSRSKINRFRYGLITNDRIVSKEDIKAFIHKNLQQESDIEISSGVKLCEKNKDGIIRVIKVNIKLKERIALKQSNELKYFLETELKKRSVIDTPYEISIH